MTHPIYDTHTHIGLSAFIKSKQYMEENGNFIKDLFKDCKWERYMKQAVKAGVLKAVTFPIPLGSNEIDVDNSNRYIIEAYDKNKEFFVPFLLISEKPDVNFIEQNPAVKGFKEAFHQKRYQDKGAFNKAYDLAQQKGLFLLIHPHMNERIEKIEYLKKEFPKLKIILAHAGRRIPFTGMDVVDFILPALKKYDDLYFDTSTIRDSGVIEQMVETLGVERILFGSDHPYRKIDEKDYFQNELDTVIKANIPDEAKEQILYKNFSRLFLDEDKILRGICGADKEKLLELLQAIGKEEQKFLAVSKKMGVIRKNINDKRHIYIIEEKGIISAFLRESGRSNNGALIEEIYVAPHARGKGYGKILLDMAINKFSYLEAKTFASNSAIVGLFKKTGFIVDNESKNGTILYWKKMCNG